MPKLGHSAEPQLLDILDSLVPLIGTEDEADYIYRTRMPVSFGRDICERGAQQIAAMPVNARTWASS